MKVKSIYHTPIGLVALQLIVFFYIYSVPLKGLPAGIGSRILFTLFGAAILGLQLFKRHIKNELSISRNILIIVVLIIGLAFISVLSNAINYTQDFAFVKYAGSFTYMLLSGYFVVWAFKKVYGTPTFLTVSNYIIIAGLIQVLLSLGMFLSPTLYNALFAIQNIDLLTDERLGAITSFRLVGVGSTFFGSGIVHGYMLILLATLIRIKRHSVGVIFFYSVAFILLFALGTMMARTTLIGTILALIVLFWPRSVNKINISKNLFRFWGNIFMIAVFLASSVFFLSGESRELLSNAVEFGFELFINYSKGEGVSSASTDQLKDMFIWPQEFRTYVIGDGRFVNPRDPVRYYMGTDVGYLRMIYCFGIIGTIAYLLVQLFPIVVCINANRHNPAIVRFFIFSFAFLLILNVKGFTDIFYLSLLFYYSAQDNALAQNINQRYAAVS